MASQRVVYLCSPSSVMKGRPFETLMKRLGSVRFAQSVVKSRPQPSADALLLLMLADQELIDGRKDQALYLVEAAYEVFDQKATASLNKLFIN